MGNALDNLEPLTLEGVYHYMSLCSPLTLCSVNIPTLIFSPAIMWTHQTCILFSLQTWHSYCFIIKSCEVLRSEWIVICTTTYVCTYVYLINNEKEVNIWNDIIGVWSWSQSDHPCTCCYVHSSKYLGNTHYWLRTMIIVEECSGHLQGSLDKCWCTSHWNDLEVTEWMPLN